MLIKDFWEKVENRKNGTAEGFLEVPNRKGFGEGLLLAGRDNPNVVALCADLTESTQVHLFKDAFPERFFEMGAAAHGKTIDSLTDEDKQSMLDDYERDNGGR
jgi:deoxyxylulose-5-phosphate synthase